MFGNLFKTYGDSVHTLFRVKTTKDILMPGYSTFFAGMSFSITSDSLAGYAHGPLFTNAGTAQQINNKSVWYYDGQKGGNVIKVNGQPAAFYVVVWGKPAGSAMQPVPFVTSSHFQANEQGKDELQWSIYPNHVSSNTKLQLTLAKPQKVKIEIYTQSGLREQTVDKHILPAGQNTISLNLSALQPGVHMLKLYAGDQVYHSIIYR